MEAFNMSEAVGTALDGVITMVTSTVGEAAPAVLGIIGVLTTVNIGFKLFKKYANKAA